MNKPVAWIKQGRLGFPVLEFDTPFRYESYSVKNPPIPLYTNPVKEQELLDEIKTLKEERKKLKQKVKVLKEKIDDFSDYKNRLQY